MKFLKKLKSGNFWVSLISAGVLIAEGIFDFELKTEYLNQILLGLMGLMTLFGIVSDHGTDSVVLQSNPTNKSESETNSSSGISNIKSICDTISLLLNKVSFSHDGDQEELKVGDEKKDDLKVNVEEKEEVDKGIEESSTTEIGVAENTIKQDNLETENKTNFDALTENTALEEKIEPDQIIIHSIVN